MEHTQESFYASFCAVRELLNKRKVSLDRRHYVLVPDKCSLFAERLLFGDGGAMDAEVLSFGRLYHKFCDSKLGFLPRAGAVMMLSGIIAEQKPHFQVFRRAAEFTGLAEKMYEAICSAIAAGLEPDDFLNLCGAAGLKLADIRLVYAEYVKRTRGRYVDADGRAKLLAGILEAAELSSATFYVAGFDRFTRAEEAVLDILKRRSGGYMQFHVSPPAYCFGDVEFYEASAVSERIKAAAVRIRREIVEGAENGTRYRDFCVLASAASQRPLARIFTEFEIPFFIDQKQSLGESCLFRYIELCESAAVSFHRPFMIALAKNHYAGISAEAADAFEDYVIANAVNYGGFCEPFGESAGETESVRARLMSILEAFKKAYGKADTPVRFVQFLTKILDAADAAARTEELSNACETDQSQMYRKLIETAELLLLAAPSKAKPQTLFRLFCEGARTVFVSAVAGTSDSVVVGGAETFRGGKFKGVYAVDFTEGVVPPAYESAELIGDAESAALKQKGLSVPPSREELNEYALNETVRLFCLTDKLFLAYSNEGGSRVSSLYPHIIKGAAGRRFCSSAQERAAVQSEGASPYMVSCKSNAAELRILSCAEQLNGNAGYPYASELKAVSQGRELPFLKQAARKQDRILPQAGKLFFRNSRVSVSRIQSYFQCPYRCFVEKGLRLSERDDGEFSAPDAGTFLHRAAELFVKSGAFDAPKVSMRKITEDLAQDEQFAFIKRRAPIRFARICDEAVRLAEPIAGSFTKGTFRPFLQEARFGYSSGNDLEKTIAWNVRGAELMLCGEIDRVDTFGKFARVIDYKSGSGRNAKFSPANLYYGRALQLPLYLKVVAENGYLPAGTLYFPFIVRFSEDEDAHRLSGVFCDERGVAEAYDTALSEPGVKSTVINAKRNASVDKKTGEAELAKSDSHTDRAGMFALTDYAYRTAFTALNEIWDGYIKPSPASGVCAYCKYGALCGFDPECGAVRKAEKIQLSDILYAGDGCDE